VNEEGIYDAIQKYGFKWSNITIKWPQSSDIVLENASKVISLLDSGTLQEVGLEYFAQHALRQIARATRMRKVVASAVPHMVSRLNQFKSRDTIEAVRNFLLFSNYQIHSFLAYLSTWTGLEPLGLSLPPVWQPFIPSFHSSSHMEDALSKLFGENHPDRISRVRLWSISGSDRTRNGEYLYVYAPKDYLGRYELKIKNEHIICEWLVPQVEFDLVEGVLDGKEI
jgi:hypothetical protein